MNRRIDPRAPAPAMSPSLDPAEAQWLEAVSRALVRHIACLKQLNPPAASAPDQVAIEFPSPVASAPPFRRPSWFKRWPSVVTIPRNLHFSLLADRAGHRA